MTISVDYVHFLPWIKNYMCSVHTTGSSSCDCISLYIAAVLFNFSTIIQNQVISSWCRFQTDAIILGRCIFHIIQTEVLIWYTEYQGSISQKQLLKPHLQVISLANLELSVTYISLSWNQTGSVLALHSSLAFCVLCNIT